MASKIAIKMKVASKFKEVLQESGKNKSKVSFLLNGTKHWQPGKTQNISPTVKLVQFLKHALEY